MKESESGVLCTDSTALGTNGRSPCQSLRTGSGFQSPIQLELGALSEGIKQPEPEDYHYHRVPRLRISRAVTSTSPNMPSWRTHTQLFPLPLPLPLTHTTHNEILIAVTYINLRFNLLKPSGNFTYHQVLTLKNSTWCPHCVYVFCTDLRTNSNFWLIKQ
jgi:hypothetical protein